MMTSCAQPIKSFFHQIAQSEKTPIIYLGLLLLTRTVFFDSMKVVVPIFCVVLLFFIMAIFKKIDTHWSKADILFLLYVMSVIPSTIVYLDLVSVSEFLSLPVIYFVARSFKGVGASYLYILPLFLLFASFFPGIYEAGWHSFIWFEPWATRNMLLVALLFMLSIKNLTWIQYALFLFTFLCVGSRSYLVIYFILISQHYMKNYFDKKILFKLLPFAYLLALFFIAIFLYLHSEKIVTYAETENFSKYISPSLNVRIIFGTFSAFILFITVIKELSFSPNVKRIIYIFSGMIYVSSLLIFYSSDNIKNLYGRLFSTRPGLVNFSAGGRSVLAKCAWDKIKESPLGIGQGRELSFFQKCAKRNTGAHNFILSILLEQGWMAGFFYIAFIFGLYISGNYIQKNVILISHMVFMFEGWHLIKPYAPGVVFLLLFFILSKKQSSEPVEGGAK